MKYIKIILIVAATCFCMTACGNNGDMNSADIKTADKETVTQIETTKDTSETTQVAAETVTQAEEIQSDTDEPDPESIQTEQETEKETETETTAEDDKYPNYPGYPKEKDGLKLCKLYVDDYECFCDGYIKDEYPDKVFFIALEVYDFLGIEGPMCVGDDSNNESFCACINGKLVINTLGKPYLNVDGNVYDDLAPEKAKVYEDFNDYCCTTLFLEKTLGATVHISADRSAAYIELGEKASCDESGKYKLDLKANGKLTATDNSTGNKIVIDGVTAQADTISGSGTGSGGKSGGNSSAYKNDQPQTRARCSQCGGSGFTNYMSNVFDPVTGGYRMQTVSGVCPSCHGTGYR